MANAALIILGMVIIAVLWVSGGAPIFQQPATPAAFGTVTETNDKGAVEIKSENISDSFSSSPTIERKIIRIYNANYREQDPEKEYIEIQADYSNTSSITISGWTLKNRNGDVFRIPMGTSLPYSGQVNIKEEISLGPGEKAVVITGSGPINNSFKPNICTGYFNQLYEFTPRLPENCPAPDKERGVDEQNNACFLYLKTLKVCRTPNLSDAPSDVNFSCREFVSQELSYASCVKSHKNKPEFFANEWRVYLEQKEEIWSDIRENIKLFDQNSNLVAENSI